MKIQTLIMTSLAAFAVQADYVKLIAKDPLSASDGSNKHSSLVDIPDFNTKRWSNGLRLYKDYDYYIGSYTNASVYACTPNIANDTATHKFTGKSLTLNGFDCEGADGIVIKQVSKNTAVMDYTGVPVYLQSGIYQFVTDGATMKMNATVQSPESNPFVFLFDYDYDNKATWWVNKNLWLNLTGDAGTAIRLKRPASATSNMQWILEECKSSAFKGVLEVENVIMTVRNSTTFQLGGTLRLLEKGSFHTLATIGQDVVEEVELAGGTLQVDKGASFVPNKLTANGGAIWFKGFNCLNPDENWFVRVAKSATFNQKTKIILGDGEAMSFADNQAYGKYRLIEFPTETSVSADDFELELNVNLEANSAGLKIMPPWKLAVEFEDGVPKLFAVRQKVITVVNPTYSELDVMNSGIWSDGYGPTANKFCYGHASFARLSFGAGTVDFLGDELFVYGAGSGYTSINSCNINIPKWTILQGDNNYSVKLKTDTVTIGGGDLKILPSQAGADTWAMFYEESTDYQPALTIASNLKGAGSISFEQYGRSTECSMPSVTLTGDNSGFAGRMAFNGHLAVNVANGSAFGGACSEVKYDAVQFTKCTNGSADEYYIISSTENDLDFSEPTRGWTVKDRISFLPAAGKTISVQAPITLEGGQKYFMGGSGVLAIKELCFVNDPATTDYYIWVNNGFVKPLSADAFNGTRLRFAEGTGIVLDWNAEGDLLKYGLRSTQTIANSAYRMEAVNGPFVISFDMNGKTELTKADEEIIHGLITVPTTEADKWYKNIKVKKPLEGTGVTIVRTNNYDGTTTFAAQVRKVGFFMAIK